MNERLSFKTQD